MWALEYVMDMERYEYECIPPQLIVLAILWNEEEKCFSNKYHSSFFYGILWLKVRKCRAFTYPLEWMSCMCVVAEDFWSYSSSSGWTRGVMDREIRWLFIASTKTCWICSKMLKIIVFMSSKLIGTIPTMWKDVLMSNIVGNCWLSGH